MERGCACEWQPEHIVMTQPPPVLRHACFVGCEYKIRERGLLEKALEPVWIFNRPPNERLARRTHFFQHRQKSRARVVGGEDDIRVLQTLGQTPVGLEKGQQE